MLRRTYLRTLALIMGLTPLLLGLEGAPSCGTTPSEPAAQIPKPPVSAASSVDKPVATTGDIIRFIVTISYDAALSITVPELGADIAGFRILDFGRDEAADKDTGRLTQTRWYELRGDLVGSYVLPAVSITYADPAKPDAEPETVETSEIFVEIQSVLPQDGTATDIRELKPLRRIARPPSHYWLLGGAIALLATLAGLWFMRRRQKAAFSLPPPPPEEVAFAALDHLRQMDFTDPKVVRTYYFAISEVLRTYIEHRYNINATDLTTQELLPQISSRLEIQQTQQDNLNTFLRDTDSVKFAGHEATPRDIESVYESALTFVEKTQNIHEATAEEATVSE